jgi:hypothetical protein
MVIKVALQLKLIYTLNLRSKKIHVRIIIPIQMFLNKYLLSIDAISASDFRVSRVRIVCVAAHCPRTKSSVSARCCASFTRYHAAHTLSRMLFRVSFARCLRVVVISSRIHAARLIRVLFVRVVTRL